jgi:hypothetical protein
MIHIDARDIALRRFLEKERIATLNLVGILKNEPRVEVLVDNGNDPRGVLVRGPWFSYVHSKEDAFFEELFQDMGRKEGLHHFSGVWRPVAERIKARFPLAWDEGCDLYALPPGHRAPLAGSRAVSIDPKDAEIIDAHYTYRHSGSLEMIRACIQQRPTSAIYVDGHIVSWILVHEDDSLGIMYTLEEHRRKGYAQEVSLDLVAKQLAAGKTPFLQIRDDNGVSPGLAKKCGFVCHGQCDWFGVAVGESQA